jgi:hypothetical protein
MSSISDSVCFDNNSTGQQDRQCAYNVTLKRVRATIVAMEKQYVISILRVCVCILVFVNRHAMRIRRIILSAVACLAPPHFSIWSYKQNNFLGGGGGGLMKTNMCLIFSATSVEKSLKLRRIQRDVIINIHTSPSKVPVIFVKF